MAGRLKLITYDRSLRSYILKTFGLYVGISGYIHDEETGEDMLGLDGKKVKIEDFAGIANTENGMRIVRTGIVGALELLDNENRKNP